MLCNSFQRCTVALLTLLWLSTLISHVSAVVIPDASSEPIRDPIPTSKPSSMPRLFLSMAGKSPVNEDQVKPFIEYHICPSDYTSGFSVRCEVRDADTVFWRVGGKLFKKEFHAPYYLNGSWRDLVKSYHGMDGLDNGGRVRISCHAPSRPHVWVDLVKSCS